MRHALSAAKERGPLSRLEQTNIRPICCRDKRDYGFFAQLPGGTVPAWLLDRSRNRLMSFI
jgi:hypothetical protein